jgi:diguanylate cyclase (GGDEF)-like protein
MFDKAAFAPPRRRCSRSMSTRGSEEDRRGDRIWVVYGLLAVLLVAYLISEIARPDGKVWPWLDNWGVAVFEIVASGLCILRGLTARRARVVPMTLGLGLMAWSLGDLVLAIESAGGATPTSPSVADAFYLCFYPITYVALMLLVRRKVGGLSAATWLDGAVAGVGAAAICAAFAFHDVSLSAGGGAASVAVNLAYPIGDVLLLGMVVAGTAILPGRTKAPWLILAIGYTINAVGDTANLFHTGIGSSRVGTLLDAVAWPTSILLISASMWIKSSPPKALTHERAPGFALPGLAAGAALMILFYGSMHHASRIALGLAAATLMIAGVRAALSVISLREITEERRRQSITDQLTGLGNRRSLSQLLNAVLPQYADPQNQDRTLAFLYVDLNGFKEVNDSFGHAAGDELLRQLGSRLKGSLRNSDLLVRLGGDEFGVVLMDSDADLAATVAERLSARLEEPFIVAAVRARISASIGIAVVPGDATDAEDLLRCADVAMYRAKVDGKSFAIYQEDLDGCGNRMRLAEELESAIANREFELHYQPQVYLPSGEIVSVEALIRWPHPRLGYVPPLEFLPLAEEAGLMGPLTSVVLEQALEQCAAWRERGQDLTVSVNISASSLLDAEFTGLVAQLLKRYKLPAEALVLEVTETTAIVDFERSKLAIEQLRDLAIIVSVDDFGAGFTSLAYLSSLAVGELKLDRSFIKGLSTAEKGRDLALVRSTIELAHSLGLRVVAEGVEDNSSLDLLTGLGCDLAQGYLISKPKPPHELELTPKAVPASTPPVAKGRQFPGGARPALNTGPA